MTINLNKYKKQLDHALQDEDLMDKDFINPIIVKITNEYRKEAKASETPLEFMLQALEEMSILYHDNYASSIDGKIIMNNEIGAYYANELKNNTAALDYMLKAYQLIKKNFKEVKNYPHEKSITNSIAIIAKNLEEEAKTLSEAGGDNTKIFKQLASITKEVFPDANKELAQYLFKAGSSFYEQNKCSEAVEFLNQALRAANPDIDKIIAACEGVTEDAQPSGQVAEETDIL